MEHPVGVGQDIWLIFGALGFVGFGVLVWHVAFAMTCISRAAQEIAKEAIVIRTSWDPSTMTKTEEKLVRQEPETGRGDFSDPVTVYDLLDDQGNPIKVMRNRFGEERLFTHDGRELEPLL